ncbi:hypothetical protein SH580_20805 [Coraliomargarita algicola]|uniref:PA14 domain-containing protein n=1 Tax=Coraliomargarita algicola TaxID=3092156 RepID=A0ABZ0RLI4_9BACT|nr:hypothetical protein [Coraliomargarita sp. J2-16]WPJ95860.1 hypothetical protein SH580_20805 [Coraliomargarita sp. J2-16]
MIALIITLVLSVVAGVVLYFNEDLRQTTFALIEETVNEEGEVVKKVKVERPEPDREQVREIARNQELKKREALKEDARKLRETVIEIEEVVETRKDSLEASDAWDQLAKQAGRLMDQFGKVYYSRSRLSFLNKVPGMQKAYSDLREFSDRHASEMKILALAEAVEDAAAWEALGQARKLVDAIHSAGDLMRRGYQGATYIVDENEKRKMLRYITSILDDLKQLTEEGDAYLRDFEKLLSEGATESSDPTLLGMDTETAKASDESLVNDLPSDEDFEAMKTAELYESIQKMTERFNAAFAENQAAALAELQQMSLEDAKKHVYVPETNTGPDLKEALSQNQPNSSQEFSAFNEALDKAVSSSERMKRQAESRLKTALGKDASDAKQTAEQLRTALSQSATIRAKMSMAASNLGRQDGNLQDLRSLMQESYSNSSAGGAGESDEEGMWKSDDYDAASFIETNRSDSNVKPIRLNQHQIYAQSLPGRRFDMESERKGWIFIDTWYIIGPWDLVRGQEFENPLPPESFVDLDATYQGKSHPVTKKPIELEWRFVQSENLRIKPPDEMNSAVYFAYTEVFSESALDVVVAVASDDRAKLWINDLVVFQDVGLSAWQMDEGFRRVLLKPGYNILLVRLENGPAVTNFSVLMCPFDALTQ